MAGKRGCIIERKGGYNLASLVVGESRTFHAEMFGKTVDHLVRNISVSARQRRDMRFTLMRFPDHVWVRRLS